MYDYHAHTTYSDGHLLPLMVEAAEEAGLDGLGFADHCTVSERDSRHRYRRLYGFNLDQTYTRRRTAIERMRERTSVDIFDAVEMDYHPTDEDDIRTFLDTADFEYAIGSVHEVDGENVHFDYFASLSRSEQRSAVETYFDRLVSLIESGLFDIVAHPDLVERNPALRGVARTEHYERVAQALATHDVAAEINAGRVLDSYGKFHPSPEFRDILRAHGVRTVLGSDAHRPAELRERVPVLSETFGGDVDGVVSPES